MVPRKRAEMFIVRTAFIISALRVPSADWSACTVIVELHLPYNTQINVNRNLLLQLLPV